jgi:hypothetical protein
MLEVELDIFSAMPNPRWVLSEREERELVSRIEAEPAQMSPVATTEEQFSLGYRGLIVRMIKSGEGPWEQALLPSGESLPGEFRVGSRPTTGEPAAGWLLSTSERAHKNSRVTDELRAVADQGVALVQSSQQAVTPAEFTPPSAEVPDAESGHLPTMAGEGADSPNGEGAVAEQSVRGATWYACPSNVFVANADVFNRPENVTRNNCYCFASNHLAGVRYALPGRRGGRPATSITCGGVIDGLRADGWKDGCQQNGLTIVLVIWPYNDYHFYRLVTGGPYWWWGHKPGGTPAKYTDDCGNSIYQYNGQGYAPNNCCRGRYTDFCGYFYQNNGTAFVA